LNENVESSSLSLSYLSLELLLGTDWFYSKLSEIELNGFVIWC